jgi:hypothetical protein
MAKQPRQERIGIYGKFTPTALDTSGADKMRALAGLGQTIADTSLSIAKPMVTAERAEQGAQAAEDAARDPVTGEVLETPKMAGYKIGASQFEAAAQQKINQLDAIAIANYKSKTSIEIDQTIKGIADQFPSNSKEFSNSIKGVLQGLQSSIPANAAPALMDYAYRQSQSTLASIEKLELKTNVANMKADAVSQKDSVQSSILQAIEEGKLGEAELIERMYVEEVLPGLVAGEAVTPEQVETDRIAFNEAKQKASVFGAVNSNVINNDELDMDQRIAEGEKFLKAFDSTKMPGTPDQKRELRSEVETLLKNAKDRDELEIEEATIASYQEQAKNLTALDENSVYNEDIKINQRISDVRLAIAKGEIAKESGQARINYLVSVDKLNATINQPLEDELITSVYDVLYLKDPKDYLLGMRNLDARMLQEVAAGNLTEDQYDSVQNRKAVLTQARTAQSGNELNRTMSSATRIIKNLLPPESYNAGMRYIFYNATPIIEEQNAARVAELLAKDPKASLAKQKNVRLNGDEKAEIYEQVALDAQQKLQRENTIRSQQIIDENLKREKEKQKISPAIITTRAEFDALPPGREYIDPSTGSKFTKY